MLRVMIGRSDSHDLDPLVDMLEHHDDVDLVGTARTGRPVVDALRSDSVDILLFPPDWFPLARSIRSSCAVDESAMTSYVVAAEETGRPEIVRALLFGFDGIFSTRGPASEIVPYLGDVANGSSRLADHPSVGSLSLQPGVMDRCLVFGSQVERSVSELIGTGLTDADIAATMSLPLQTVRNHIEAVLSRNELTHRTQLAVLQACDWKIPDYL